MRLAIHQPNLFPRLKVLQKISAADCWVILDNVQYVQREWQNRTWLVPVSGKEGFWLSLPVRRPSGRATRISAASIVDPGKTRRRVMESLRHCFGRAPYWSLVDSCSSAVGAALRDGSLADVAIASTVGELALCGIRPKLIRASELGVKGRKSKLMAAICRELNADVYLADSGAQRYLAAEDFGATRVLWQRWVPPEASYSGLADWRNVSSVNYLAREGPIRMREHLTTGRFTPQPEEPERGRQARMVS